ncbi:MAG TPA: TfuA-like protein [Gemmatimonadaceae bacterium]|jgi:hypothetical protein|nr:TfuA-like protein [Gemmatimonadaceae bacterium]
MREPHNIAFVGPTLGPIADSELLGRAGFEVFPPVRRGDIDSLLENVPGIIVIVDGRFNETIAVGHAEIRRALRAGWEVWGLSSMGAIRAYEMRDLGMRGFGRVFEHFLATDDFQDDEVALLHLPAAPYEALSEPLIHVRNCLAAMQFDGEIGESEARAVVSTLKSAWFGARTLEAFIEAVGRYGGPEAREAAVRRGDDFDRFRSKSQDLMDFFANEVWLGGALAARPARAPYM